MGEEKDGKIIANKIDKHRKKKPINPNFTTACFNNKRSKKKLSVIIKRNPATKTFQAIRMFVNKEITELMLGLIKATKLLSNNGGMLIVVSFHSLEDKNSKKFF